MAAVDLSGLRVLIVEDEALLAHDLKDIVSDWGCLVTGTAVTVDKALELVAETPFDVAILDLLLHGKTVEPVAAAVISAGRTIVFASGSNEAIMPASLRHYPMISKPYSGAQLFAALSVATQTLQSPLTV